MTKELVVSSVTVSVEVQAPRDRVFAMASDQAMLPRWTHPVKAVRMKNGRREVDYLLPEGVVTCSCDAVIDAKKGIIDWTVHIPKGEPVKVFSRVVALDDDSAVYVFTLLSPPMPKHRLKDAYGTVSKNLLKDLNRFKELVHGV
ncbi:MAG TPA: hypothetical protein VNI01_01585 [Elusimicrobiota bacterium]|jgi:uncharacterized membrane protein|nr:hypothetical protein [Elusimicrobiota bacterium]